MGVAGGDGGAAGAALQERVSGAEVEFGEDLAFAVAAEAVALEGGLDGGGEELRGVDG